MKGILLYSDGETYYKYPDNIDNIEDFVEHMKKNFHSFVKLTQLDDENSTPPYFVENCERTVYLNPSKMDFISEYEYTMLSQAEYDRRLNEVVNNRCKTCVHHEYDEVTDSYLCLDGFTNRIDLDGRCFHYERAEGK